MAERSRVSSIARALQPVACQSGLHSGGHRTRRSPAIPGSPSRDFAILLLLARLALRAGEVTALKLEDIDWEAGVITVRGKTRRAVQLPLPQEVGEAIADYLSNARPKCKSRQIFITARAPYHAFHDVGAISESCDSGVGQRQCCGNPEGFTRLSTQPRHDHVEKRRISP
jgi:integrase